MRSCAIAGWIGSKSIFSIIRDVHVTLGKNVNIELKALADSEFEIWTAQSRADLFQNVFGRGVTFTVQVEPRLSANVLEPSPLKGEGRGEGGTHRIVCGLEKKVG